MIVPAKEACGKYIPGESLAVMVPVFFLAMFFVAMLFLTVFVMVPLCIFVIVFVLMALFFLFFLRMCQGVSVSEDKAPGVW